MLMKRIGGLLRRMEVGGWRLEVGAWRSEPEAGELENPPTSNLQPPPSDSDLLLRQSHNERGAAVQASRLFTRVVVFRARLTADDRVESRRAQPSPDQVIPRPVGAARTEREVVFRRSDVARVAFDLDTHVRILLEHAHGLIEYAQRFRPQAVAVEVEVHVLEND